MPACAACGCRVASPAHAIVAALADDDIDRAIEAGLLDAAPCPACAPSCRGLLQAARGQLLQALAARTRHRQREARLQARAQAREARAMRKAPATDPGTASPLPPAAAAALARALARAGKTA